MSKSTPYGPVVEVQAASRVFEVTVIFIRKKMKMVMTPNKFTHLISLMKIPFICYSLGKKMKAIVMDIINYYLSRLAQV